jgi:predicted acyltransferase
MNPKYFKLAAESKKNRLVSLDLFRGLVMFLLVAEGSGLYHTWLEASEAGTFMHSAATQFHHHPWNGLRFWDLVQPYFMFIVGVAMWFSVTKRQHRGDSRLKITLHILRRCLLLLVFGVGLYIASSGKLVWELWNVLAQLSVTILIAYAIMRLPGRTQLIFSIGLLLLSEALYRFTSIPGYDQPFVKDHNFGSFMDMILMGKLNNGGGWVAFNFIPTAAHTIWGVLAGKLLASSKTGWTKIQLLLIYGGIALFMGYLLNWSGIDPIIKRICTASFVLASGGWALLTLAFFYWLVDIKGSKKWTWFFVIVGMNPIFIYLFMNTAGSHWLVDFSGAFITDGMIHLGAGETLALFVNSLVVLALAWGLCYWLYRRKIFFKI